MKRKKWCKDIVLPRWSDEYMGIAKIGWFRDMMIPRWMMFCPICGKPRPKNVESV